MFRAGGGGAVVWAQLGDKPGNVLGRKRLQARHGASGRISSPLICLSVVCSQHWERGKNEKH